MKKVNIYTKKGELNKLFLNALKNSRMSKNKIYPASYTGSGRYINLSDYSFYIEILLKDKGYKYTRGNDAPRSGKNGDFIKVSKTAMNYLLSLREAK